MGSEHDSIEGIAFPSNPGLAAEEKRKQELNFKQVLPVTKALFDDCNMFTVD